MTKSLGNTINIFDIINGAELQDLINRLNESYLDEKEIEIASEGLRATYPKGIPQLGTDATRLTFISYSQMGRKANLNLNKIISNRNFCNKMWNAIRYSMKFFNEESFDISRDNLTNINDDSLSIADKWILNRLNKAIKTSIASFEDFTLGNSINSLIHFFHDEFCSIYLESIKSTMKGNDEQRKKIKTIILYECIETSLRLFHPFMPYITEDLWQRIPKRFECSSIMISPYPSENEKWDLYSTEMMEKAIQISSSIRKMAQSYNINLNKIKAQIATNIINISDAFDTIYSLTGINNIEHIPLNIPAQPEFSVEIISDSIEIRIDLRGLIDFQKELDNAELKKQKLMEKFIKLENKTKSQNYTEKVPIDIQNAEKEKLDYYNQQISSLETLINNMKAAVEATKK